MKRLFKKAMRDILADRRRAFLSLLAILVGMAAFGVILFSYQIINRELIAEFDAIHPASAAITVDRVDDQLLALTSQFDGIEYFEERAFYEFQAQAADGTRKTLELHAAQDYSRLQLNKVLPEAGSYYPAAGEALIERDALSIAGIDIGDTLIIADAADNTWTYTITGVVSDIYQHPASMHNSIYLYASYSALDEMGLNSNIINYSVTGDPYDREHILAVSSKYVKLLEENGYIVTGLEVSETPGISMHYEEYISTLILLQIFSLVMFLFGCLIMSGLITSILSVQIRQIGILKALGCNTRKIMQAYLLAFMSLLAVILAISIPIITFASKGFASITLGLSNMQPDNLSVSWSSYLIYCVFTLTIALIAAWLPVRRGIRIPVRIALTEPDTGTATKAGDVTGLNFLSRPVLLSIRNALRRKGRFYRNVVILSLGGALFASVITAMIATRTTISNNLDSLGFDYQVLSSTLKSDVELQQIISKIPYVTEFERWGAGTAQLIYDSGFGGNYYPVSALRPESQMIEPDIIEGRWIDDEDSNAIVVSHKFLSTQPQYTTGSIITLQIGDKMKDFTIVGVVKNLGEPTIFMSLQTFDTSVDKSEQFTSLKLSLDDSDRAKKVYTSVESDLREHGIGILSAESIDDISSIITGHFTVTLQTFGFIIFMLVIVSGFGLAATMDAQTAERTREIGIIKAIGGSRRQIFRMVTAEGLFISLVSWIVSIVIGILPSIAGIYILGDLIMDAPLDASIASFITALILWLFLIIVISLCASRSAASRSGRLTIATCFKNN